MIRREDLLKAGFSNNEINEIEMGIKEGLDVSKYANTRFHSIQMRQIRIGLSKKLDVSQYANPDFDWLQMEEIRRGLEDKVDTSIYAKPEIPFEKMRQIRKGLAVGINLTAYLKYNAGVMRQLRKARLDKVNILNYVNEGYDKEQLEEIRIALVKHIDLDPYLKKEYAAPSIAQIREGLEIGVDVSIYANTKYSWFQMREIRLGLEHRIDATKYISHFYTWQQMREIRLGLEEGLDVSDYGRLRFPANEMHRRHELLKKEFHIDEINQVLKNEKPFTEDVNVEEITDTLTEITEVDDNCDFSHMHITVDANGMIAYIVITQKRDIARKDIIGLLKSNNIVAGILENQVTKIVEGNYSINFSIQIASGQIPHKGDDGFYEYLFRTDVKKIPKVLKDGTVDYRNVDWFETVKEGQIIAIYHSAKEGVPGFNVFGNSVAARHGVECKLLSGSGFIMDEDKKTYRAEFTGMITLDAEDYKLNVSRHLEVENVNFATGNLVFDGSIHVLGNVTNGVRIEATDDIVIDGSVESAEIVSGGSVLIKQGMNSGGKGFIKAKKDVSGRFFESANVESGGDIHANSYLNCRLQAEGKIESTIALSGGIANAQQGFKLYNVGNTAGIKTLLQLFVNENDRREKQRIRGKIAEVEKELTILLNAYTEIQEKYPSEIRNTMELYLKIENAIYTKKKEMDSLHEQENEIQKKLKSEMDARIIIRGNAFEGTTVDVGRIRWRARNEYNISIRRSEVDIEVVPNV